MLFYTYVLSQKQHRVNNVGWSGFMVAGSVWALWGQPPSWLMGPKTLKENDPFKMAHKWVPSYSQKGKEKVLSVGIDWTRFFFLFSVIFTNVRWSLCMKCFLFAKSFYSRGFSRAELLFIVIEWLLNSWTAIKTSQVQVISEALFSIPCLWHNPSAVLKISLRRLPVL